MYFNQISSLCRCILFKFKNLELKKKNGDNVRMDLKLKKEMFFF